MSSRFRGASFSGGNNASFARENAMGGSQPLGAGKGPMRSQMDKSYPLADRMAARRMDKALTAAPQDDGSMMQPAPSRLDASPTPGLDAQPRTPITYGTKQGRMAEQGAARMKSSMSGAFGERAKAKTVRDVNATVSKFRDQGMAMMGRGTAPAMATKTASVTGAPAATPPAAPLQGRALAERNIATKGIQGAAADYFARSNSEMLAKQSKGLDSAMAKPQAYQGQPTATKQPRTGINTPAASGSRSPMTSPARPSAPTMAMGSSPKPAAVAQSDADDYGGAISFKERGMGANTAATDKVRSATNKIDSSMNKAGLAVVNTVAGAFRERAGKIRETGSAIAAAPAKARAFSDRTNAAANEFSRKLQGSLSPQTAANPKSRFRR